MSQAELVSLDLHGLTRERAIRAVTDFIEVNKRNTVRIITGSGSHSTHGPVLRTAVENLLSRRQMTFKRDGAGCFIVDCSTGETFYRPDQPRDTKVVVASAVPQPTLPAQRSVSFAEAIPQAQSYSVCPQRTRRVVSTTTTKRVTKADGSTEETTSTEERIIEGEAHDNRQEQVYAECLYADDSNCGQFYAHPDDPICGPWMTPAEASAEGSDYYNALERSLEDHQKQMKASQQALMEVDLALKMSLEMFQEQEAREREKELSEMQRALRLSEKEAAEATRNNTVEEDELFLVVLERSKSETKYPQNTDEDEEMKRILELSKNDTVASHEDEEELLRKVLEESQKVSHQWEELPDRELEEAIKIAMEQSLEEDRRQREEENELMKQVLRMSMR